MRIFVFERRLAVGITVCSSVAPLAAADTPLVPAPHPLITEVLYAVPSGLRGDASGDGTRDAIGDEFIELTNPHDQPIQLKGYTIMDADAYAPGAPRPAGQKPSGGGKPGGGAAGAGSGGGGGTAGGGSAPPTSDRTQWKFVFPELELKPGQTVVVFNGFKGKFTGPCGEPGKPAPAVNDRFSNAYVFTIGNTSPYAGLGNDGDFVLLQDASGKPIQVVKWGDGGGKSGAKGSGGKNPPSETLLVEDAPIAVGSVQRDGVRGKLIAHKDLPGDLAGSSFSPGVFSATSGDRGLQVPDKPGNQRPSVSKPADAQPTSPPKKTP